MGELRRVEQALRLQPSHELLLLVPGHGSDAVGHLEPPLPVCLQPQNPVITIPPTTIVGPLLVVTIGSTMCCRRSFEYAKERHLIDFPVTSEYDQTRYDALLNRLKTLDNAIINLDKTVMLLDKL